MRTRRSREQWAEVLDELAESGESVGSFCRRRGLRPGTLSWWKWKLASTSRRSGPECALRLLPIEVSSSAGSVVVHGIVIDVGDARMHVEVGTDVAYVSALVESLRRRC
jgi:hypothetical protein